MKTLCVVPCGKRKIWDKVPAAGPTEARLVYIGPFAKKCREYAQKFYPDSWCILSAKYGFLFPQDIVPESYNISFNDLKSNPINIEELKKQISTKNLDAYDKIVVLGGKNYVNRLKKVFPYRKIHTPLLGFKGMGYMLQGLNNALEKDIEL